MDAEQDKMVAAFTKKNKISLNVTLTGGYTIYKENPDRTIHYKAFYLVDKGKCIAAANSALEKSLQDSGVVLEMADQIREFVKNGLTVTE